MLSAFSAVANAVRRDTNTEAKGRERVVLLMDDFKVRDFAS